MRVLVVEDEQRIATAIKTGLQQERFAVDLAFDGNAGFDLAVTEDYDVIVLDLMLPGKDGMTICKDLRSQNIHTPILMLTAKSQTKDKVGGLDSGADDYLIKPFSFEELVARIKALTRRNKKTLGTILQVADLTLDPKTYRVKRNNSILSLSAKEFSLLEYLMKNAGEIVKKDQIIAHVWDYDADVLPNTVEANIKNLRKKIDVTGRPLIKTVRGFGYKIE